VNGSLSRLFGTYYRVAFYGVEFEELNGKEYVYKEPKLTKLGEITIRLRTYYESKFGERVKIITKSGDVEINELDVKNFCYIQVTSVDPYFESWELRQRQSHYEQCNNISQFIFSTPFTKSGKGQTDDVNEQYKRKTIISVGTSFFPYMTTRLEVKTKSSFDLNPLENGIELIEQRTAAILTEINSPNPDPKLITPVLTGAVSAVINQGPLAICKAFLDDKKGDYPEEDRNKLRYAFIEFIEACKQALDLNETLISPEELELHHQLQESYLTTKSILEKSIKI